MEPIKPVKDLLDKQMSREDFLKHAGLTVVGAFGTANLVNYLMHHMGKGEPKQTVATTKPQEAPHGFGASKFGV